MSRDKGRSNAKTIERGQWMNAWRSVSVCYSAITHDRHLDFLPRNVMILTHKSV
jgi:hypothetical protein